MAVTTTSYPVDFPGGIRVSTGELTFDSSYPTGGEAVTAAQWGATQAGVPGRQPDFVIFEVISPTTTNKTPGWIKATGKVTLYGEAASAIGMTSSANTTDHSLTIIRFTAFWVTPGATITSA